MSIAAQHIAGALIIALALLGLYGILWPWIAMAFWPRKMYERSSEFLYRGTGSLPPPATERLLRNLRGMGATMLIASAIIIWLLFRFGPH